MGSKFKKNLSDIVLVGAIIGLGTLVLYLAYTNFGRATPNSFGGATGQRDGLTQTHLVTPTLTLAPRPTHDPAHDPPTRDPEAPTFDDPALVDHTPSKSDTMPSMPLPQDPFHISECGDRATSVRGVVPFANIIIIGTVSEVLPSRWTTPDGKRPENPHEAGVDSMAKYGIVTQINVTIEQQIRGVKQEGQIRTVVNAGKIGNDSVDQCGATDFQDFQVGQHVLLFLYGKGSFKLDPQAWLLIGRYNINDQGLASNQQQQIPLDELRKQIEAIPRFFTPTPQL